MHLGGGVNKEYIALIGSPNSGKSSLFNWLTGGHQKVVNYPGSTVDMNVGELLPEFLQDNNRKDSLIIDTPGIYSLFPKTPDEEVTLQTLYDPNYNISKVVFVLDSTQLSRQWHLFKQIQESGFAIIVAVTMHDLYSKEGQEIDLQRLTLMTGVTICPIDGIKGDGVQDLAAKINQLKLIGNGVVPLTSWNQEKTKQIFSEGQNLAKQITKTKLEIFNKTEARDRLFLHPVWGLVLFFLIMSALFSSIYWLAQPLMDQVELFFSFMDQLVQPWLGAGLIGQFVSGGIIAGLGSVMVFVPQIFILFLGVSLLEDSGYLARAATLIDKPFSKIGLNGKAFVPLLSGFACAVPAMMSARSINSRKERWIVMFIIPFMTCSARLPVYALLISFLFFDRPILAGAVMAGLYLGAVVVGVVAAAIINQFVKFKAPSYFLMELPLYRRPRLPAVFRNSWRRTKAYIYKTGPIILVLSIMLWVLSTFPNYREENMQVRLQSSYAAQLGAAIEPIFKPIGVDWRVGVGLISAFAAREVFVSSLAVMFNVTEGDDEDLMRGQLQEKMRSATFADGLPIFTFASVAALVVFFMIAMQCISTTATAKQEMQSTRFALTQLVIMNLLAYAMAWATYNILA